MPIKLESADDALRQAVAKVVSTTCKIESTIESEPATQITVDDLGMLLGQPFFLLQANLSGQTQGTVRLALAAPAGICCAKLMLGTDADEVTSKMNEAPEAEDSETLTEIANQVFGHVKTVLREAHDVKVDVEPKEATFHDPSAPDFEVASLLDAGSYFAASGPLSLGDFGAFPVALIMDEELFERKTEPTKEDEEKRQALEKILGITLPVSVVVAQRSLKIEEVLAFVPGTVLEFEKPSDTYLDLMVSEKTIGCGEAVRVGERFGLRLIQIGSPAETIMKLSGS
jgi:flagellar motor switch protein FliN/FliY